MKICIVADPVRAESIHHEGGQKASLSFFFVFEAEGEAIRQPLPPADLYVMPIHRMLAYNEETLPGPILAYGHESAMAAAFERGCLDFLREPWGFEELELRSQRFQRPRARIGEELLELAHGMATTSLGEVRLTEAEEKVLRLLVANAGRAVGREAFSFALSGTCGVASRAPDVHISALRAKLEGILPRTPQAIISCRGKGYMLAGSTCG